MVTLGLPVTRTLSDSCLARFLGSGSAIAFLRRKGRRLVLADELAARPGDARDEAARRRASTGTATPGRSSSERASLR
ncbi:hypothetical protein [Sphingomonas sp. PP-CE-3G-477]|uniref:hypothetical protein n=1 Tax=Sphingomonas sp. PP-CE-3G-477 TaxID=2135660 RepID=UPI000D3C9F3B|nr:hypothetical protein [Sphingomonas sp. PP-CE-3G-477]